MNCLSINHVLLEIFNAALNLLFSSFFFRLGAHIHVGKTILSSPDTHTHKTTAPHYLSLCLLDTLYKRHVIEYNEPQALCGAEMSSAQVFCTICFCSFAVTSCRIFHNELGISPCEETCMFTRIWKTANMNAVSLTWPVIEVSHHRIDFRKPENRAKSVVFSQTTWIQIYPELAEQGMGVEFKKSHYCASFLWMMYIMYCWETEQKTESKYKDERERC